jgi:hypothetical protein
MLEVIVANKVIILGFLLALSELLALIPSIKANSVFQILVNAIKKVAGK